MSKISLRHTLIKKTFLTFFFLTTYLYTFSLYENSSFIIFSAVTEYISTRSCYRNINFSIHLAKWFQRRRFSEMSNLYRGPYNDASNQISVYLGKQFQRRRFVQKSTDQKQELPVVAMLVNGSGRNEPSLQKTFHKCCPPSFVHLAKLFQKRRFFKIGQLEKIIACGGHAC